MQFIFFHLHSGGASSEKSERNGGGGFDVTLLILFALSQKKVQLEQRGPKGAEQFQDGSNWLFVINLFMMITEILFEVNSNVRGLYGKFRSPCLSHSA